MSGAVSISASCHGESPVRKLEFSRTNPIVPFVFNKSCFGKPIQSQSRSADTAARPLARPEVSHICVAQTDSPAARTNDENEVPAKIGRMQFVKGTAPTAFPFLIEWIEEAPTT